MEQMADGKNKLKTVHKRMSLYLLVYAPFSVYLGGFTCSSFFSKFRILLMFGKVNTVRDRYKITTGTCSDTVRC